MKQINLNQDILSLYQDIVSQNQLESEHLLSILGPMNAKLENTTTLIDAI